MTMFQLKETAFKSCGDCGKKFMMKHLLHASDQAHTQRQLVS